MRDTVYLSAGHFLEDREEAEGVCDPISQNRARHFTEHEARQVEKWPPPGRAG